MHHRLRPVLVAIGVVASIATAAEGRSIPARSADTIIALTRSRFAEIGRSQRRLDVLPRVVSDVDAPATGSATFTLRTTPLTEAATSWRVEPAGGDVGRLVHGGYVLGAAAAGGVDELILALLGGARSREGPGAVRWRDGAGVPIEIPGVPVRADRADRWYVTTTNGLLYEIGDGPPRLVTDHFRGTTLPAVVNDGERLLVTALPRDGRQRDLRVALVSGGAAVTSSRRTGLFANPPALLARGDGVLLAVGDRILPLDDIGDAVAPEEDLAAAIAAAAAGDDDSFGARLERLSRFDAATRRGLENQLRRMDDPSQAARRTLAWFEATAEGARIELAGITRTGAPGTPLRLAEAMRAIAGEADHAAARLRDMLAREHPLAPGAVAGMLARGRVYRDGLWMHPSATVLFAEATRVLLRIRNQRLHDAGVNMLALVDSDGHLATVPLPATQIEWRSRGSTHTAPLSAVPDPAGDLLIFSPATGLGRFDGTRLDWFDESGAVRTMTELIGCDHAGRLFFRQRDPITGARHLFVYRPEHVVTAVPASIAFGTSSYDQRASAVVDTRDRVWFISADPGRLTRWREAAPPAFRPAAANIVRHPALSPDVAVEAEPRAFGPALPTLYCHDAGGRLHWIVAASGLDRCGLVPAADGAVLAVGADQVLLATDDRLIAAGDLTALARDHFDDLLAAAPRQPAAAPEGRRARDASPPALARTGDVLWITQDAALEAFRAGTPLDIGGRVTLRTGPITGVHMHGVLESDDGWHVLLAVTTAASTRPVPLWATLTGAGEIKIAPISPTEEVDLPEGGSYPVTQAMTRLPRMDEAGGRLLFTTGMHLLEVRGPGRYAISEVPGDAPRVMPDGSFLVHTGSGAWPSVVRGGLVHPLDPVWLHDLAVAAVDPAGTVWCTAWNGLVALREDAGGTWRVDERIEVDAPDRVTRLLGETASDWILACDPGSVVRVAKE